MLEQIPDTHRRADIGSVTSDDEHEGRGDAIRKTRREGVTSRPESWRHHLQSTTHMPTDPGSSQRYADRVVGNSIASAHCRLTDGRPGHVPTVLCDMGDRRISPVAAV